MIKRMFLICTLFGMIGLSGCGHRNGVQITEENVTENTIAVEGLMGEYDFLFLTDTHIVVSSTKDSEQESANAAARAPGFVDEMGISSAIQFPAWMRYAREQKVDAVLLGGDIIDTPSSGNIEHLRKALDTLTMPYLYTLGNHDWTYPWEYMTERGKAEYLPLLEPMMQGNTKIGRLDIGELTIVEVDNSSGQVNGEALESYRDILAENRPTIVMLHVPFMTPSVLEKAGEVWSSGVVIGGSDVASIEPNEASAAFLEMTTAKDSPVIAVIAGHVHLYDKDYIAGEKNVLQLVGDAGYKRRGMLLHIAGIEN